MSQYNSTRESIRRIQERKELAARENIKNKIFITLSVLFAIIVVAIFIIVGIVGAGNHKKKAEETRKAGLIKMMAYSASEVKDTSKENFDYVRPVERGERHVQVEDDEFDRLDAVTNNVGQKVCYLTFDDGPNTTITPQVLDVLRKYDVKATFFMLGYLMEDNSDMARRVYEEGHLLANHTYSHTYDDIYASTDAFMKEIEKTEELILDTVDSEDEYFPIVRFPGGSHEVGKYKDIKGDIKDVLAEEGYYHCDWNSLNGDAEGKTKDAEGLFEFFEKNTSTSKNAVVLMHDTVSKQATVDSLGRIIEYMLDEGYVFLRLDEEF